MTNAPRIGSGLLVLLALVLSVGALHAVQFNVSVTNGVGTRLPGTHAQILVGSTVLYEQNCTLIDDRALAQFDVAPGTYFLRLIRSGYPDHVYIQTVGQEREFRAIMGMQKSTYTIFGLAGSEPQELAGDTIKLIDEDSGTVVRNSTIQPNGGYLIDSLWPDKTYRLRIDAGGARMESKPFSYSQISAYYIEVADAQNPMQNISTTPVLSGPSQVARGERIELSLLNGERAMAGQVVEVRTPNGAINLSTDAQGKARLQAAEGGNYTFSWGGQTVRVSVPMPIATAPKPVASANNTSAPTTTTTTPILEEPTATPSTTAPVDSAVVGTSILLFIAAGAAGIVLLALLVIFGPKLYGQMMNSRPSPKASGPLSSEPITPPPAPTLPPSMSAPSQEAKSAHKAAPKHHAGAHHAKGSAHKKK